MYTPDDFEPDPEDDYNDEPTEDNPDEFWY
ncbi:hypothetical protein METP1_02626 [Methanosarcinales archaeon]|nr:hypothetical protein METP1_02626 [Methanosarcinales archaeon]